MKLSKFNYLFTDISYYLSGDNNLLDKLNSVTDYEEEYLTSFKKELNKNILKSTTKSDCIKYYLFELFQIQNQFKNQDEKFLHQIPPFDKASNKHETYIKISHFLFNEILTEIQICCLKYGIDFFFLCHILNVDCTLFDCGIAMFQEDRETKIKTIENSVSQHENIFSNNGFLLFEYILNEYVKAKNKRGRLSDINFFYWSMYNNIPQLIHQRPQRFKEWFFDNYDNEDLGKIKTFQQVANADRLKHYSNALEWFKTLI